MLEARIWVDGHLENELPIHVFFKTVFVLEVRVWAGPVVFGCFGPDLEQTRRADTTSITQADGLDYAIELDHYVDGLD